MSAPGATPGRARRALADLLAALIIAVAVALGVVRIAVTQADLFRERASAWLSEALGAPVSIGTLSGSWRGWLPEIEVDDLTLLTPGAASGLHLRRVRLRPDLLASMHRGQIALAGVAIDGLAVALVEDPDGRVRIRGLDALGNGSANTSLPLAAALLAQAQVHLSDATVIWIDRDHGERPLALEHTELTIVRDTGGYRLAGDARLPEAVGERVEFAARIAGRVLEGDWSGEIYAAASGLHAAATTERLVPDWLEIGASSRAAVRAWSSWAHGRLGGVRGTYRVDGFSARIDKAALGLPDLLGGAFAWTPAGEDGWTLLASASTPGAASTALGLRYRPVADGAAEVVGRAVNVPLAPVAAALAGSGSLPGAWARARIDGRLAAIDFATRVDRSWRNTLIARGRVRDVDVTGEGLPVSVRSLDADWEIDRARVAMQIGRGSLSGSAKDWYARPLAARGVAARVFADLDPEARRITVHDARADLDGVAIALDARAEWSADGTGPSVFALAEAGPTSIAAARRWLPDRGIPAPLHEWLQHAAAGGGRIAAARALIRVDGPARMSFANHSATFRLEARLGLDRLAYAPGWPALDRLHGDIAIADRRLEATVRGGGASGATIEHADVVIKDMAAHPALVSIRGQLSGRTEDGVAFLTASPIAPRFNHVTGNLAPSGPATLDLAIDVPLDHEAITDVSGTLALQDNTLELPGFKQGLEGMSAKVEFDRGRIRTQDGVASYLGRRIAFRVERDAGDRAQTHITLDGSADRDALADHLRNSGLAPGLDVATSPLFERLRGETEWRASLAVPADLSSEPIHVHVETELDGVRLDLPDPFMKRAGERARLVVDSDVAPDGSRVVEAHYGDAAAAVMALVRDGDRYRVERGYVRFGPGRVALPSEPGVVIEGRIAHLAVREWRRLLAGGRPADAAPVAHVRSVDLHVATLDLLGIQFDDVAASARRGAKDAWVIAVTGDDVEGHITVPADLDTEPLRVDLQRLALRAPSGHEGEDEEDDAPSPQSLPAFEFVAERVSWDGRAIGSIRLRTSRQENGLRIEHAFLSAPGFEASATGGWYKVAKEETRIEVHAQADSVEALLTELGYGGSDAEDGPIEFLAKLHWPGRPSSFALVKSAGVVHFRAGSGRLLDVPKGTAGRLFGLLSLPALPRRLLLDFRDVFEKGLRFERMEGSFAIDGGNAYTNNMMIDGPTARIDISGRTGLVDRDYDQLITVTPRLSSSLPLAPVWLAQKLFGKPVFDRAFSSQYTVTGSWDDPQVERVAREPTSEGDERAPER